MSVTLLKHRKTAAGQSVPMASDVDVEEELDHPMTHKIKPNNPILKLPNNTGLVIKKLSATTAMKRNNISSDVERQYPKYKIQPVVPVPSSTQTARKDPLSGHSQSNNNTIITTNSGARAVVRATPLKAIGAHGVNTITVPRQFILKSEAPKRTVSSVTLELIEKNPLQHLGVHPTRMRVFKNIICHTANVTLIDAYLTLKKLRQNEDFALLAEYFELTESMAQQIFVRSICRLARYMRFLICWPDSNRFYERYKNLPFAFRANLFNVQSLVQCVETEIQRMAELDFTNYKFIFSITPNGIISYISDAFVGHNDDLAIFKASNFQASIPKYLTIFADPGKGIRRKNKSKINEKTINLCFGRNVDSNTDSADEFSEDAEDYHLNVDENGLQNPVDNRPLTRVTTTRIAGELVSQTTLQVEDNLLVSRKAKNFAIPTVKIRDSICRVKIGRMLEFMREFKILQPYAIQEPLVYQYLNETLIVAAALINLNH